MTTATYVTSERAAAWQDGLSLGAHVQACDAARGRSFAMQCIAERLHALLSPRFFTTVFAATVLMALLAGCA
jgi:hypothetical protein